MKIATCIQSLPSVKSLLPALLLAASILPLQAAAIAGLDGISERSTFENQGITALGPAGLLGWTNVTGEARFFDAGGDGSLIHNSSPYGNYSVQYNPQDPIPFLPNTQYSLTFNMGYVAGISGGLSGYEFSLGSVSSGVYTPVSFSAGIIPHIGNMHSNGAESTPVTLSYTTGAVAPGGTLALQWAQTQSTAVAGSSDFFGFNHVTLDATAVPEPSASLFIAGGLGLLTRRRQRVRSAIS